MNVLVSLVVAFVIFEATAAYVPPREPRIRQDIGGCWYNGELIREGKHKIPGESCGEIYCFRDGTLKVGRCPYPHRAGDNLQRDMPYPQCCVRSFPFLGTEVVEV